MEFLYISSLGMAYQYVAKIKQKLKQNTWNFGSRNPQRNRERKTITHRTKGRVNMDILRTTNLRYKQIGTIGRRRKTMGSGATSISTPGITLFIISQISHWWLS